MGDTVEILFKTRAELEGALAAQRELEKTRGKLLALGQSTAEIDKQLAGARNVIATAPAALTAGLEDSARAADHSTLSHRELHRIIHAIGHESPLMGQALRLAINPIAGALIGGVLAAKALKDAFSELEKHNEIGGKFEGFGAVVDAQVKALQEAGLAAVAYERSLAGVVDQSKKLTDITALAIDLEKEQARHQDEQRSAELALTKARIDAAEKSGQLTSAEAVQGRAAAEEAYARQKISSEAEVARAILNRLKVEQADQSSIATSLELRRREAAQKLAGTESPAVIEARLKAAEKNLEATKEEEKKAKEPSRTLELQGDYDRRQAAAKSARESAEAILQAASGAQFEGLDRYNAAKEEAARADAEAKAARARAGGLGEQIQRLSYSTESDIESRGRVFGVGQQTRGLETSGALAAGAGGKIEDILGAEGGLEGQGLSRVEATAQAISQSGLRGNTAAITAIVERMTGIFDASAAQQTELYQQVMRRLDDIARQVQTSRAMAQ
jgi:hypothetical protein